MTIIPLQERWSRRKDKFVAYTASGQEVFRTGTGLASFAVKVVSKVRPMR